MTKNGKDLRKELLQRKFEGVMAEMKKNRRMKYHFFMPTALKEINNEDDNIDVCVRTSDGHNYTFVIATEKNIIKYPGLRAIIVKEITPHSVKKAIKIIMKSEKRILDYYGSNLDCAGELTPGVYWSYGYKRKRKARR